VLGDHEEGVRIGRVVSVEGHEIKLPRWSHADPGGRRERPLREDHRGVEAAGKLSRHPEGSVNTSETLCQILIPQNDRQLQRKISVLPNPLQNDADIWSDRCELLNLVNARQ
jgi:hypothetical protein